MKPLRSSYPVGHLLNPQTRYVPSHATDVAETIRRAMKRQQRSGYLAASIDELMGINDGSASKPLRQARSD